MKIIDKPWDSEILRLKTGELECDTADNFEIYAEVYEKAIGKDGYQYITSRVPVHRIDIIRALEWNRFKVVDCYFRMWKDLTHFNADISNLDYEIREATEEDLSTIVGLARDSFTYDRYHNDSSLTKNQADAIHSAWAYNAVTGKYGDRVEVVVDVKDNELMAFSTLRLDGRIGHIDIAAVKPTAVTKKFGMIGRHLVRVAFRYFNAEGCRHVLTGTQAQNQPSYRMNLSEGFEHLDTFITLSYRSKEKDDY